MSAHLQLVRQVQRLHRCELPGETPPLAARLRDLCIRGAFGTRVLAERVPRHNAERDLELQVNALALAARRLGMHPFAVHWHSPEGATVDYGGGRCLTVRVLQHGPEHASIIVAMEE